MPAMYDLTALTGKSATESRTIVVDFVEVNATRFAHILQAAPAGILVFLLTIKFFGIFSLVAGFIVWFIIFGLLDFRVGALKQRAWRTLMDANRSRKTEGKIFICGAPALSDEYQHLAKLGPGWTPAVTPAQRGGPAFKPSRKLSNDFSVAPTSGGVEWIRQAK